jgi:hypothetical protein
MWLPCFRFPAVPHFNNRHLRVTCSTSRASAATSTVYFVLEILFFKCSKSHGIGCN